MFGKKIDMQAHEAAVTEAVNAALAAYTLEDGTVLSVELYEEKALELDLALETLGEANETITSQETTISELKASLSILSDGTAAASGADMDGDNGLETKPNTDAIMDALPHNKKADSLGLGQ